MKVLEVEACHSSVLGVRWILFPALFVQMNIKMERSNFQRAFSEDLTSQTKLDNVEVVSYAIFYWPTRDRNRSNFSRCGLW